MMRWIIGSSLRFRFIVIALATGLMFFGARQLRDVPVDVFPEFAPPLVEIQTPSLGLSEEEVESLVTVPLEQALSGVPGLDVMRSKSVEQLSAIKLIFEPGTDLLWARQLVAERVSLATPAMPTWAAPPVILPPLSATSRCMKIGISSKKLSLMDLSMISYWTIRQRLMKVPGVANVPIWGERLQMLQVQVDPARMAAHGVTLDQVMEATGDALDVGLLQYSEGHLIGTGGWIDTPSQRLPIRVMLPIVQKSDKVSADPLAEVVIRVKDGTALHLRDVADVVVDHPPLPGDGIVNDGPGLLLIVEKFPWGNTLEVTRGVEAALDALRPGLPGVEIDTTIFRPATFIEVSINNLTTALVLGAILVVLVLGAFLYEWRAAVISLVAMPLSLLAAGLVLYLKGATINVMVLAGLVIALGVVVDDAIIDVQNIVRRLRQHRQAGSNKSTAAIILEASLEVRSAITYATLIIVLSLLPVFFLEGLTGAFFQPLATAYALAVLVSMVVALTVTPALSLLLLSNTAVLERESPLVRWLERGYQRFLAGVLHRPRWTYVAVGAVMAAGLAVYPFLGQTLLPSFKERDFLMHWLTKPGTSHPEEVRISVKACQELRAIPGVRNCGSHIGQALIMDEVVGVHFGENWISVDPKVDYDETLNKVQALVDSYPGLYRDVQTYLKERIREVLTGSHEAITVRIFGRELGVLRAKAQEVREALSKVDGLVDLKVELQEEIPQIQVEVDLAKAHRYGIKPGDVRRAASTLVAGEEVGDIHIANRTYDVNVWSTPETRGNLTNIHELPMDVPGGGHVRMEDVADVRIAPTPNVIKREHQKRRIDVGGNVKGRDLGSVVADVERALEEVKFPREYHPELIGEYTERQAAQKRLLSMSVLAVIGIFFLLQASFGSRNWRLAFLAFLSLPSALVGGVLAAYFGDGIISLGSLVGFLTILGIAARNGIMMITHFEHLESHEGETFGHELVLRGARERLSPILMTALTAGLALVPLVVGGSLPGHEIEHPLAVVVLGGLVTSTLLNLFVIPVLYLRFGAGSVPDTKGLQHA